ncbi:Vacuolar protease A [Boothiomyces sp. JEL0866]|nr:Vacuolar protease A [Boothiomyces sp. JEL0866]
MTNVRSAFYTTTVIVGSNQYLNLDLDTGSSDTWFRSSLCTSSDGSCPLPKEFDASDSAIVDLHTTFDIAYVDKSGATCEIYLADVSLGGFKVKIPVGLTKTMNGFSKTPERDGLLGLGFNEISKISSALHGSNANWFDSLRLAGDNNVFSFFLSLSEQDTGELTIGGYDPSRIDGEIYYFPLSSSNSWEINIKEMKFQIGTQIEQAQISYTDALLDTGSTNIYLEQSVADRINSIVGGVYDSNRKNYIIDCKQISDGPDISFVIQDTTFSIPSTYYISQASGYCFTRIKPTPAKNVIFGDLFMKAFYTIFDKGNKRIGLAVAKQ